MTAADDPFLAALRRGGSALRLINERTGAVIADRVELAVTSETRRKGLLGRDAFDAGAALIIAPCSAIHMFFMRFPIDVVFVNRSGQTTKVIHRLKPWRIALSLRAYAVVELGAGTLDSGSVTVGDRMSLR